MNKTAKVRGIFACFGLMCCFTGFSARLVYLQVDQHEKFERLAAEKHVKKQPIIAGRGEIRDVNGELLAANEPLNTIVADGSVIAAGKASPSEIAGLLSDLLKIPKSELTKKLDTQRKYVVLKKSLTEPDAAAINGRFKEFQERTKKPVRGIFFEPDTRRVYPNNETLCHVLGFMGQKRIEADGLEETERMGVEGVERSMDKWLRGYDGFRYIERDRTGKEIVPYRGQERTARDGYNVRLTVDMRLQHIVETELDELYKKYRPEFTTAIMMDPKTGRILAMANRPCFDPNDLSRGCKTEDGKPLEIKPEKMKNCAVINIVEPGSVFKIVPVSAALNDKLVDLNTVIGLNGGRWDYGGKILKDHGHCDHPDLSVFDVVVHSSNIGSAKLGLKLGEQRFYEYVRSFGFGERTGINLPGEVAGIVHSPKSSGWNKLTLARMPMGQGVSVTPIQMVTAMSVIANGGKLMMPQIVDSVIDNEGNPIVNFDPVPMRQVVGAEAAAKLRSALKEVVSKRGTAFAATIPGYSAGGKTGTAQIAKPGGGGYYDNRYVTSFVGFFPAEDPQIVCLVMVDDAKAAESANYGGLIAGPAFSHIGEQTARYLNIPPDLQPAPEAIAKLTRSDR